MKRISFEAAKAIKEAGYPQGNTQGKYSQTTYFDEEIGKNVNEGEYFDEFIILGIDAPEVLDVWLWLWKEKKIYLELYYRYGEVDIWIGGELFIVPIGEHRNIDDPEEAISKAIEYLVDNDLIK